MRVVAALQGQYRGLVEAIYKLFLATAGSTLLPGTLEAQKTATAWDAWRIANYRRAVPLSSVLVLYTTPKR